MFEKQNGVLTPTRSSTFLLENIRSCVGQVKSVIYVFISLFLIMATSAWLQDDTKWLIDSVLVLAFFIGLLKLLTEDTCNIVAGMTLWTVVIFASSKAFYYDGLYDTSLLLYPCVLIFASLLGGKGMIIPLSCYMLSSLYFFAYSISINLVEPKVLTDYSSWAKAIDMSVVLAVFGMGVLLISGYIKALIVGLVEQNKRYNVIKENSEKHILFDELTGLPNAEKCKLDLIALFSDKPKNGDTVGFVTLHMNNFSWINSTLGHNFGDRVLHNLSERFVKLQNDQTYVYRTSGIEFTFIKLVPDFAALQDFCHQTIRLTILPLSISEYDFELTCSLGGAIGPFDGQSFEELNRKASFAVYKSKEEEPNSYHFYENEMEASINRRLNMNQELKLAIEQEQFELYYQPKVHLATNQFVGAEALIRWRKGDTLIYPDEFIGVAEESGLIVEIGRWALETACAECSKWQTNGLKGLSVAVNLSPLQFKRGNLPTNVFRALQKADLDPNLLELEITESLFIDDTKQIEQQIFLMVERGVYFAIDDFGTGYSNLNYLSKFNASTLKIDMSFVRDMVSNLQLQHIVNAIIKMSHVMDLENVAEGVEDAETAEILKAQGCVYGQGYYWSKPLPAAEFMKLAQAQIQNK
ncbi:MAG: diguanylate cyclase (GGDEF)-like protein [Glaciecola sp.]